MNFNSLPNELNQQICSYLTFADLMQFQRVNRFHYKHMSQWTECIIQTDCFAHWIAQAPEKLKGLKSKKYTHLLVKIGYYGTLLLKTLNKGLFSGHEIIATTQLQIPLALNQCIHEIIESDPYSFHVYHRVCDSKWDLYTDFSLGTFASCLKKNIKIECQKEYTYQLYPLARSDEQVKNLIRDLLMQGYSLKTMVDGTVGMVSPCLSDSHFEVEPLHWQEFFQYQKMYYLRGYEMPMVFQSSRKLLQFFELMNQRWKELYSDYI